MQVMSIALKLKSGRTNNNYIGYFMDNRSGAQMGAALIIVRGWICKKK